jgi:hypothetical protein
MFLKNMHKNLFANIFICGRIPSQSDVGMASI